jgi:O-antigen ligase
MFWKMLDNSFADKYIYKLIAVLTVWQFLSVGLMAVGTWPMSVAILNTVLLALFLVFAKPFHSVLLLVLSIPFFVILPNPVLANFPMWRVLFALLFVVWFIRLLVSQRAWLQKLFTPDRKKVFSSALSRLNSRLMPWDKIVVLFFLLASVSLLIARFPVHGLKQILFLLNIYLFYIVTISVTTDAEKLSKLIRYTIYSLGIMVGLGFVQYIGTLFASPYYFWQYWATLVSSLYYGNSLAEVLSYSNSWFAASASGSSLRMFGILPDTHAFGVMCIFLLSYLIPSLRWPDENKPRKFIVVLVILTGFGVMASGTRGVWLSMLASIAVALVGYWRGWFKSFFKITLAVYAVIIMLFVASPVISQGLNLIRTFDTKDDFLNRAGSIYDLNESSNAGRLEIWQHSVKFAATHPFGVGYGNFIVSIVDDISENSTFEQVSAAKNLRYNLPQAFITAHSLYLQLLVELGFAGLLAFGLIWWEYFESLYLFLKKHLTSRSKLVDLVLSLTLGFLWLLAYGAFDVTILNDRVLMYLFISLAISGLIFAKDDIITKQ